jgi:PAS domain S-box-containing protein
MPITFGMKQVGPLPAPTRPRISAFAVSGSLAVAMTLVLAIVLSAIPFLDPTIPDVPVLLFIVPVGLCAVCFGVLGGLAASLVGVEVALVWFLQGQHFAEGLLDLSVQGAVFVLVGALVGSIASERRELGQALAQHHELSLDLMSTASFDGFFTKLNPAWTHILGYERHELMSRPFLEFIHPGDVERTKAELQRQIEAGESVLHFQNRYRHADGSYRWLRHKPHTLVIAPARIKP